jgi:hypothetical protein
MDFESWRHCGGTLHYRASVIIVRRSVNWAQRTFERPRECAVERPQLAGLSPILPESVISPRHYPKPQVRCYRAGRLAAIALQLSLKLHSASQN